MTEDHQLATGSPGLSVIVLAAGEASRFGSPKQLAYFHDKRLLTIALDLARKISERIVLVTGAYYEEIANELGSEIKSLNVHNIHNPDWDSGMGTSIRAGVLSLESSVDGALILLVDQPLVTESHLKNLVEVWCKGSVEQGSGPWAVATSYSSSTGVPALFDKSAFEDLCKLNGDEGARYLLNKRVDEIISLQPDFSLMDIDTPEQLEELKKI